MIVMTPLRGGSGYSTPIPTTNTQARRTIDASVYRMQQVGGPNLRIAPRGVGFTDSVPMWAWAAGGGLVAGLVVGAVVFKK